MSETDLAKIQFKWKAWPIMDDMTAAQVQREIDARVSERERLDAQIAGLREAHAIIEKAEESGGDPLAALEGETNG